MNRNSWLRTILVTTALASPALAQAPTPFDMTPESDLVMPVPEAPTQTTAPTATQPAPVAAPSFTRYVLPDPALRLDGEDSRQAAVVYLTEAQAATPARLEFSYLNALVVAPEVSNLRLRVNGTEIVSQAIASSSSPANVSATIPAGVLRAGANTVEFSARQRHRTDCSVNSTYELWTELQSGNVRIVFDGAVDGSIARLADLAAVGVDETGATTIRLLNAQFNDPQATSAGLKLVQQLAIALRVPHMRIEMADTPTAEYQPGVLDVAIQPASALTDVFEAAQAQASSGPLAAMVPSASGANTLLISGPDWSAIQRAGDALLASAPLTPQSPRIDLPIPHPMMMGGQTVELSQLGVETSEFNGRRYFSQVQFELPPDFYAYRYGELELVLDAAYSRDVLPGSEIDIYTNGQIASATPLLRTDGGMLRDTVVRIPMTNLRPGRNEVAISVNLLAQSDEVCSPGWTGQAPTRFVLSDTSQLRLPNYARAAAVPDLLVVSGSGWPYAGTEPVPVALGSGPETLTSAMLFLARIASASGQVLPVEVVPAAELAAEDNAIVVMPVSEMPPPVLSASGVAAGAAAGSQRGETMLNQFGGEQTNAPWIEPAKWALERVGLELDDLRLWPAAEGAYPVPPRAVVMSQVHRDEGGIWTLLTAADAPTMLSATAQLVVTERWRAVAGRVSALTLGEDEVTVVPSSNPVVVETQAASFPNLRLVAANWFSGNILYFAGAIILVALALMGATSFVLSQIGRRQ